MGIESPGGGHGRPGAYRRYVYYGGGGLFLLEATMVDGRLWKVARYSGMLLVWLLRIIPQRRCSMLGLGSRCIFLMVAVEFGFAMMDCMSLVIICCTRGLVISLVECSLI